VLKSLKAHIASLKAARAAIEADIAQLVEECETLRKKVALTQTVTGIVRFRRWSCLPIYLTSVSSQRVRPHGLQDWHRSTVTAVRSGGHATQKLVAQPYDVRSIW
jgi:hypothetical protein